MGDLENSTNTLSPHQAFAAIGNEIRVEILHALWESRPESLPFIELFDQVNVSDTGQFNYHLNKVLGHFVEQCSDGYQLRNAGREVVLAVLADVETDNPLADPVPVGPACYHCGTPIKAWYDDGWLHVECKDCGRIYAGHPFPSAGLQNRTVDEILMIFEKRLREVFRSARRGICSSCTAHVVRAAHSKSEDDPGPNLVVKYECVHCGLVLFIPVGLAIMDHPDIVRFHTNHAVDLSTVPFWELEWCYDEQYVDVRSTDPLETLVRVPLGQYQLEVTVDESFAVTDTAQNVK